MQFATLGKSAFALLAQTDADNSIGINAGAGRGSVFIMQHNATNAFLIGTTSANEVYVAINGVSNTYFFSQRGIAVNVEDNSAAFTVTGNALGLIAQIRQGANAGDLMQFQETGGAVHIRVTTASSTVPASLVVGKAPLANAGTDGFLYVPTVAGVPTGVPTAYTGTSPIVYDTTNNFLYVYNGGWKKSTVYA